jgi:hypothetical protein
VFTISLLSVSLLAVWMVALDEQPLYDLDEIIAALTLEDRTGNSFSSFTCSLPLIAPSTTEPAQEPLPLYDIDELTVDLTPPPSYRAYAYASPHTPSRSSPRVVDTPPQPAGTSIKVYAYRSPTQSGLTTKWCVVADSLAFFFLLASLTGPRRAVRHRVLPTHLCVRSEGQDPVVPKC